MSSVTSLRVSKGGNKFAPKAKPRPTRRSKTTAATTQESSAVDTPTDESETQNETRLREHTGQEDVRQAEIEAGQALQQLRVPTQAGMQSMGLIPQVVGVAPSGIPIVRQGSIASQADEIPTVVGSSQKTTPRRLRVVPHVNSSVAASAGNLHTQILPRTLPNRPPSTRNAQVEQQRLASLNTITDIPGVVASDTLDMSGQPSGTRAPASLKRRRTRDSASSSSRRITPDPMPQMRLKQIEDYPVLETDEISHMSISYFCKDNRHGRPTQEFIARENSAIRKMYEPLSKNSSTNDGQSTQTAAAETSPAEKSSHDASGKDTVPSVQPAAPSNRLAAQVRIVDGKVVVDSESLVISRSDMAGVGNEPLELVDESARPRYVNSLTYVQKRGSRRRWSKDETEAFFEALRKYGSDFEMISAALPGRNRYDIRNKFKAEDKANSKRVTDTLLARRSPPPTPLSADKLAAAELQNNSDDAQRNAVLERYTMAVQLDNE